MFNLIKFATHFGPFPFGSIDPMLIELIRQERQMKAAAMERETAESASEPENEDGDEVRKAA